MGTNPCPLDIEEYWDNSIAELDSFSWDVNLTPSDFKIPYAECFDLTFTGLGGARVYAKYLRPANSPGTHPAIMEFHGYRGNSGDWTDKLKYVAAGFCVAATGKSQGGGLTLACASLEPSVKYVAPVYPFF